MIVKKDIFSNVSEHHEVHGGLPVQGPPHSDRIHRLHLRAPSALRATEAHSLKTILLNHSREL